jgi:phospholipase D1/2
VALPERALPLGSGTVGFSRTDARGPENTVREVEHLLVDAIGAAERLIYIETQYFSSHAVCEALVGRMRAAGRHRLEIVIIVNAKPEALKEELAVGLRQAKILTLLAKTAAETQHRLGAYMTLSDGDAKDRPATYIHSKLLSIDDRFLTVGSANLTNRSMGVDTELNVTWEAAGVSEDDQRLQAFIRALRVSLRASTSSPPRRERACARWPRASARRSRSRCSTRRPYPLIRTSPNTTRTRTAGKKSIPPASSRPEWPR